MKSKKPAKVNSPAYSMRYIDISPKAPGNTRFSASLGAAAAGFDQYGYPAVRNLVLPSPFSLIPGRNYGSAKPLIQAMEISSTSSRTPSSPSVARVTEFKLKPSSSIPAAPSTLSRGFDFCVQKGDQGDFLRFRDARNPLHGHEVEVVGCAVNSETGEAICKVILPGQTNIVQAPLCDEEGADKEELPPDCCVKLLDGESGQLVCAGSSYDLLIVKVVADGDVNGAHIVSVEHPDLPGGGARLVVCGSVDEDPGVRPCCIEEDTGLLVCPEGSDFHLQCISIPLKYLEFKDGDDGLRLAVVRCEMIEDLSNEDPDLSELQALCGSLGGHVFYACTRKPAQAISRLPKPVPDVCCYDEGTGTLICEGTQYHGLAVNVITDTDVGDMRILFIEHPSLPGGSLRVQACTADQPAGFTLGSLGGPGRRAGAREPRWSPGK